MFLQGNKKICLFSILFTLFLGCILNYNLYNNDIGYVSNVTRNMYLEDSELVYNNGDYYLIQPNGVDKKLDRIEIKDNQNKIIELDESKAILFVNGVYELDLGFLIIQDYYNILYLDEELYNMFIDGKLVDFNDYLDSDLLTEDGLLK